VPKIVSNKLINIVLAAKELNKLTCFLCGFSWSILESWIFVGQIVVEVPGSSAVPGGGAGATAQAPGSDGVPVTWLELPRRVVGLSCALGPAAASEDTLGEYR